MSPYENVLMRCCFPPANHSPFCGRQGKFISAEILLMRRVLFECPSSARLPEPAIWARPAWHAEAQVLARSRPTPKSFPCSTCRTTRTARIGMAKSLRQRPQPQGLGSTERPSPGGDKEIFENMRDWRISKPYAQTSRRCTENHSADRTSLKVIQHTFFGDSHHSGGTCKSLSSF